MVLPVSMNPCENLNSEINELINSFEQETTILRSQIEAYRQQLASYGEAPSTQEAVAAAVGAASVNDVDAGLTAITQIRNFTGTCLQTIINEAVRYSAIADHEITDKIGDITSFVALPETDLLTPLRSLRAAMGVSQASDLLKKIDEKLNCLSGQGSEISECLSLLDDFNDRVDAALNYLGFGADSGDLTSAFDLDTFLDNQGVTLNSDVLTNLKSLDGKMDSITTEAKNNVKSILKNNKFTPQEWF